METYRRYALPLFLLLVSFVVALPAWGAVTVQCPGDTDGDAVIDTPDPAHPNAKCMHLTAGDGFVTMADGSPLYMFGFADVTGIPSSQVMQVGSLAQEFSAPPIVIDQGAEFYLTLTNVGMAKRPDLFDPHTVHYHGFPQSSNIYDGLPESGIAINMGASLTYYYLNNEPGTYMYHCHVEATEHMQMGMLGSLYVHAAQDITPPPGVELSRRGGNPNPAAPLGYAYNDGDGSTAYDLEYAIQLGGFDSFFHGESGAVQKLPFALMRADYAMLNGRGYPDTVALDGPVAPAEANPLSGSTTQPESALVTAQPGQRVLLRLSNLEVTRYFTLASLGIPMRVVGKDAKLLRGPNGTTDLSYITNSLTFGGGQSYDVILDIPAGVAVGSKYFLYATDLNFLVNNDESDAASGGGLGGMLTEIRIDPAP